MKVLVEKRNSEVFLRPRFTIDLKENNQIVLNRFSKEFKKSDTVFRGKIVDEHIFIDVPQKKEHFWSPQLHLEIIERGENESILKGLFGPKPQVWTLFMFVHFIIGISFLCFLVMLYTQISLNESFVFPLIMMIFLPLLWVLLYVLGSLGKDTGKKQMKDLHDFMIRIIDA